MEPFLTGIQQLTPSWLSAALRDAGISGMEHLAAVRKRPNPASNSQVAHLDLEYKMPPHQDTPGAANPPTSLLLKLNQHGDGETEVRFYEQAASLTLPMLVKCLASRFDSTTGNSFLILQDVSVTHQAPVTKQALIGGQGVPERSILIGIAEALACFHAAWWQRKISEELPRFAAIRDWYASSYSHAQHCLRRQKELDQFFSNAGTEISPEARRLLETALDHLPHLWEKYIQPRVEAYSKLTLSHGDCYLTQFLVPKQPGSKEPTYLVDFDSASGNFPAYDLVYLLPTFWSREQRLEDARELHFLQHYHTILCQCGVENYCFAELCQDYRLMLCYMLFDAAADQVRGSSPAYWRPKLGNLIEAYQDWDCSSLS